MCKRSSVLLSFFLSCLIVFLIPQSALASSTQLDFAQVTFHAQEITDLNTLVDRAKLGIHEDPALVGSKANDILDVGYSFLPNTANNLEDTEYDIFTTSQLLVCRQFGETTEKQYAATAVLIPKSRYDAVSNYGLTVAVTVFYTWNTDSTGNVVVRFDYSTHYFLRNDYSTTVSQLHMENTVCPDQGAYNPTIKEQMINNPSASVTYTLSSGLTTFWRPTPYGPIGAETICYSNKGVLTVYIVFNPKDFLYG